MDIFSIYLARNKINNKSYVGYTKDYVKRVQKHYFEAERGSKLAFHQAIKKYGKDYFEWTILYQTWDREHSKKMETHFIKELNTNLINGYGYNMTKGGEGSFFTPKMKEKARKAKMGDKNPMFGKVGTFLNKKHSPESIDKIKQKRALQIIPKDKKYGRTGSFDHINSKKVSCPVCKIVTTPGNAKRWHFYNCKRKVAWVESK